MSGLLPSRRAFIRRGLAGLAGVAAIPERILADPYSPWRTGPGGFGSVHEAGAPIRVRGVVRADGRGLSNVPVSDGLQVVDTAADGRFELVTTADRGFVFMSVPSGHQIPVNHTGTARFYQAIDPGRPEQSATFDVTADRRSQEEHTLLLLGDIQTEDREETGWFLTQSVPDMASTVQALGDQDVFGISAGDIMFDNLELYPEYERGVRAVGVPFFQVIGNHDLDMANPTDESSTDTFSRHFGPRYYSFNRGLVHYVVLDDVFWHGSGYLGYLGADALTWLAQDLARVEAGSPVVVTTHIPVLGSQHVRMGRNTPAPTTAVTNREALYRLLEPFQAHLLTCHTHECEHVFEGGTHEHVAGAVCGAWWSGPICHDGTPSGYSLYEVRGEEITWRYKSTGLPDAHQMRIYPPGADPAVPDELVVNVWNWDPEWSVRWFVDGDPRGALTRRTGLDPLSVELHAGRDLPPGGHGSSPCPPTISSTPPTTVGDGSPWRPPTDLVGCSPRSCCPGAEPRRGPAPGVIRAPALADRGHSPVLIEGVHPC